MRAQPSAERHAARQRPGRPSRMWGAAALLALALGVFALTGAFLHQSDASRPIGEGELFLEEAAAARALILDSLARGESPQTAVRRARNAVRIEGVALIGEEGRYVASTSENLVGSRLEGFLAGALEDGRFAAIAEPLRRPLFLDDVEQWETGDVLYQVLQPLGAQPGAVLLSYDVSELLARRARAAGIRPETLQLAGAGAALVIAAVLLLAGRSVAERRIREAELEARFYEERSRELERHNRELDQAKRQAERALALAEETNRIRSEFVLMINHELRTPLTSLVTGAELLLEDAGLGDLERKAVLGDMVKDGRRLKDLISQMLTVARIENQGLNYSLRETGLGELRTRLAHITGRVGLWEDGRPWPVVRTDPEALAQLLASLADNAFTHGASSVQVEVAGSLTFSPVLVVGRLPEDALYLLVRDDGPGIDRAFLPRAFEKFEKEGRASGTGLGLYLARMMAEGIDGGIAVDTGPGGTTMAVAVPVAAQPSELPA